MASRKHNTCGFLCFVYLPCQTGLALRKGPLDFYSIEPGIGFYVQPVGLDQPVRATQIHRREQAGMAALTDSGAPFDDSACQLKRPRADRIRRIFKIIRKPWPVRRSIGNVTPVRTSSITSGCGSIHSMARPTVNRAPS